MVVKGCTEDTLAKVLEVYTREDKCICLLKLDIKAMFHSKAKKMDIGLSKKQLQDIQFALCIAMSHTRKNTKLNVEDTH